MEQWACVNLVSKSALHLLFEAALDAKLRSDVPLTAQNAPHTVRSAKLPTTPHSTNSAVVSSPAHQHIWLCFSPWAI
jgi:hypothetical protein